MPAYTARFRNPQLAAEYLAAYDASLALWPVPHEELDVETRFGTTHINIAGSPDSPPLLLIHGGQISSTVWYPNVGPLSRHFRVYAPDVVDQAGRSVPTRKLTNREDCLNWLIEVMDALGLDKVPVAGHSHGGWFSINLAILAPERVERMILLGPAGLTRLRAEMFLRVLPVFIIPTKGMFYRTLQWITTIPLKTSNPVPIIDQFILAAKSYKAQELGFGVVHTFEDEELRQIEVPTLLLVGEHEKVLNRKRLMERARRLMPNVQAEVIAGAAHFLPIDQPDIVTAKMLEFLR